MKKLKPLIVLIMLMTIFLISCSKDIRDFTLEEIQDEEIKKRIQSELTEEERKTLMQSTLRFVLKEGIDIKDKDALKNVTITIRELITNQNKFIADRKKQEEESKRKQEQEENKKMKEVEKLKKLIDANVLGISFLKEGYSDYLKIGIVYENKSNKTIVGFKGIFEFYDMFGEYIYGVIYSNDENTKPNKTINRNMYFDYNQFKDEHVKLKNADFGKLKTEWKPSIIMFSDGTKYEVTND